VTTTVPITVQTTSTTTRPGVTTTTIAGATTTTPGATTTTIAGATTSVPITAQSSSTTAAPVVTTPPTTSAPTTTQPPQQAGGSRIAVAGTTQVRGEQLAKTGSNLIPLALMGFGLILCGRGITLMARRQQPHAS
jgi:hypothetical protein